MLTTARMRRSHRIVPFVLSVAFLLCLLTDAAGQHVARQTSFGFWSGANVGNGHAFGFAHHRRLVLAGLSWAPLLTQRRRFVLKYRIDLVPLTLLRDQRFAPPGQPKPPGHEWVYAAGISPVGAQMEFPNRTRIMPFAEVTGGFLYFRRRVLAYDGTRFQFTVAPGVGLHVFLTPRLAIDFGYKYHHFSNANMYRSNPALDSHMLYAGVSVFRR